MDIQKDEAFELAFSKTNFYKGMVESLKNKDCPFESVFEIRNGKYRSSYVQLSHEIWQAAKANAVPDLSDLQERIAGHQYYHDDHGHMIVDMDDVVKEISGFDSWKSQAVPEKDAVIKKLSDQLYAQEMKASAARVLCETACELLDDYAHQDAMVILDDLEQAMKEPANE